MVDPLPPVEERRALLEQHLAALRRKRYETIIEKTVKEAQRAANEREQKTQAEGVTVVAERITNLGRSIEAVQAMLKELDER